MGVGDGVATLRVKPSREIVGIDRRELGFDLRKLLPLVREVSAHGAAQHHEIVLEALRIGGVGADRIDVLNPSKDRFHSLLKRLA
jgi:hypothetical protein